MRRLTPGWLDTPGAQFALKGAIYTVKLGALGATAVVALVGWGFTAWSRDILRDELADARAQTT